MDSQESLLVWQSLTHEDKLKLVEICKSYESVQIPPLDRTRQMGSLATNKDSERDPSDNKDV
jgi:hypothetical protein